MAVFLCLGTARAQAPYLDTPDTAAIKAIYQMERSPMPWWTVAAFKYNNPTLDVAGLLAILKAESGLGVDCGIATNNPGGIKGGPIGSVWRDLRVGEGKRDFNLYGSLYDGQRAALLLIWTHYNADLATHDWYAVGRYYGRSVPGYSTWKRNVIAACDRYVRMAAGCGADW